MKIHLIFSTFLQPISYCDVWEAKPILYINRLYFLSIQSFSIYQFDKNWFQTQTLKIKSRCLRWPIASCYITTTLVWKPQSVYTSISESNQLYYRNVKDITLRFGRLISDDSWLSFYLSKILTYNSHLIPLDAWRPAIFLVPLFS